jgi:Cys-tRNA(Pro)/Cys-tRNA(Cys) deacylase
VIDASALGFETIFVSAGRRGLQLELAPADLVLLSSARSAAIARDHGPG